jgi:hypothetical protein
MKRMHVVTLPGAIAVGCASTETKEASLIYPVAKKDTVVDDYAAIKVADPYRGRRESAQFSDSTPSAVSGDRRARL